MSSFDFYFFCLLMVTGKQATRRTVSRNAVAMMMKTRL